MGSAWKEARRKRRDFESSPFLARTAGARVACHWGVLAAAASGCEGLWQLHAPEETIPSGGPLHGTPEWF